MLRMFLSDRNDMIEVGYSIQFKNAIVNRGHIPIAGWPGVFTDYLPWGWSYDRLNWTMSFDVSVGTLPIQQLIRFRDTHDSIISIGNRKPHCVRNYSRAVDGGRYGGLSLAYRRLADHTATNRRHLWTRETDVVDASARGLLQLSAEGRSVYSTRGNYSLWNWVFPIFQTNLPTSFNPACCPTRINYLYPPYTSDYQVADSGTWLGNSRRLLIDELPMLERQLGPLVSTPIVSGYETYYDSYSDFSVSRDGDGYDGIITFSYTYRHEVQHSKKSLGVYPHFIGRYKVECPMSYHVGIKTEKYDNPVSSSYFFDVDFTLSTHRKYVLEDVECIPFLPAEAAWFVMDYDRVQDSSVVVSPLHTLGGPGVSTNDASSYSNGVPLLKGISRNYQMTNFTKFVEDIHPDIRPAAALSANDCMSSYSMESNLLESVPQLPGMLKSIKDVSRFGSLIQNISAGDPKAIDETIDFLADGYLLYSYGVKPSLSDISESKRVARMYYEQMDIISSGLPTALYGSFFYKVPARIKDLPGSLQVTIRSKMVLRSSPATILSYAIALDSVGMLPTLARIWDLVPFSFVIDWFTSLGDRFADIDHFVARIALDVDYYVHTYLYEYILDSDSYTPFRRKANSEVPQLRMFIRERSQLHPVLGRTSRFDFHPPKGLQSHVLSAGALLWSQ